jgi:type II secretory pathway pseudopilin PulG
MRRFALSLLEFLIVVGIIAVLISIILPAVQAVRASADRAKSANHMRQIILAVHQFATHNNDRVPSRMNWHPDQRHQSDTIHVFLGIAPYLDIILEGDPDKTYPPYGRVVPYVDPADISSRYKPDPSGPKYPNCSYAYNVVGTTGSCSLNSSYPDGTTHTMAMTTHYMLCGLATRQYAYDWMLTGFLGDDVDRRATFADIWQNDVVPVTRATGGGNVTMPSRAGATFQVKPKLEDCDPYIPQGLHYGGLHSAMFDGSVKFWRSGVRPQVFWAAVTPNGNETDFD